MALREYDLFGNLHDKVARAVEIAKSFCPPEGYYLAYSGGKDSTVVKAVLDMAGVKYDAHYNVTTVDPPELVRFIISQFDAVVYEMPEGSQKYYKVKPQGTKLLHRVDKSDIEGGANDLLHNPGHSNAKADRKAHVSTYTNDTILL